MENKITDEQIAELKKLAEAVGAEKWIAHTNREHVTAAPHISNEGEGIIIGLLWGGHPVGDVCAENAMVAHVEARCEFIAAANPEVVKELIDALVSEREKTQALEEKLAKVEAGKSLIAQNVTTRY